MTRPYPDLVSASDWVNQISLDQSEAPEDLGSDASSVWNFYARFSDGSVAKCRLFSQAMAGCNLVCGAFPTIFYSLKQALARCLVFPQYLRVDST